MDPIGNRPIVAKSKQTVRKLVQFYGAKLHVNLLLRSFRSVSSDLHQC